MKSSITVSAPAKINLALDITGKREDGYHLLETVFQSISVYDKLDISLKENKGIDLSCSIPWIPCNEKNLAYKAAAAFTEYTGFGKGVKINLEKKIPSQAGMGGGSSDAAAVLKGMNVLAGEPLSSEELCSIAAGLGADVPFFIYGGTAYAEGIGEKLEVLPLLKDVIIVAAKGKGGISTPEAYRRIDALETLTHPKTQELRNALKNGADKNTLWQYCGNVFEEVTDLKDVADIRSFMLRSGAAFSCMSGSGAAVFGIFNNIDDAKKCRNALQKRYPFAVCCTTC